ncbi:2-amino-4-hydroxy-6-hydroxymethyldihydropteridine diphosphokinase [Bacteriovorax stolpii]|uniref:2-amino-4-hydroxy-6-hydroxymethyldihydropteridine pyrophosphokinase n=1 Tax=Bacteriovorax stolpii TaxID=960 RepID=A0A2K9NX41_BACTC|nr:2-amino-4-hydroxy-6-hydroxymethyldihydropteridine diphosphokinase [Bacteriovorax stolpii]AUO00073.1 2-amino-4-hydroxy-6-hydroxymethyldihydropteridine diphosphokinase [Bacteriovorax stolpii]QDK39935.1 2-amino-4-hydroxy-6-hydroxymethyldihydropteridine diphosphokinase [Bacteriovorax stolpii]TDP54034.1 2-amino-4-hydroxy-6-hydroxymethyldihydropteridine diphosphokinase [Bacteriovorax stolpii]
MSLFIATGSNLGERKTHLEEARNLLSQKLTFIAESRIYESPAVDYLNQPDFYNQVLEFKLPADSPESIMDFLLETEKFMGRNRTIPKGPRIIDLDILFWSDLTIESEKLTLPHPRLFTRSFVVLPLSELPGFKLLQKKFPFTFTFDNTASPIS